MPRFGRMFFVTTLICVTFFVLSLAGVPSVQAATYDVDITCSAADDAARGVLLQNAVTSANVDPGADVIILGPCTYELTSIMSVDPLFGPSALSIATGGGPLTINTVGPATLRWNGGSGRIMLVEAGVDLVLDGSAGTITFRDGHMQGADGASPGEYGESAYAGALVFLGNSLTATYVDFIDNMAVGGDGADSNDSLVSGGVGGAADSGAVLLQGNSATISWCNFIGNQAIGGDAGDSFGSGEAGDGGKGFGGALGIGDGQNTLSYCTFRDNAMIGGDGGDSETAPGNGGYVAGGAIRSFNVTELNLIENTIFEGNQAIAGDAGDYILTSGPPPTLTSPPGRGGVTYGGAIYQETAEFLVRNSTFYNNEARGGDGSDAGTTFPGGHGGWAFGGAYDHFVSYSSTWEFVTMVGNIVAAGSGGDGVPPGDDGEGHGTISVRGSTLNLNASIVTGTIGSVEQIYDHGKVNNTGSIVDALDSLYESDAIAGLDSAAALHFIPSGGFPGETFAIDTSSLAFDGVEQFNCVSIDQRGVTRPQGNACDIGAYEAIVEPETVSNPAPTAVWSIDITASPAFGMPGGPVTFTITVSKLSGGTPVTMAFPVPAGFIINDVSSTRGTVSADGQTVTFTDDIHAGEQAVITVNTTVAASTSVPFSINAQACLTSPVSLCDSVVINSVSSLPATGETPVWAATVAGWLEAAAITPELASAGITLDQLGVTLKDLAALGITVDDLAAVGVVVR